MLWLSSSGGYNRRITPASSLDCSKCTLRVGRIVNEDSEVSFEESTDALQQSIAVWPTGTFHGALHRGVDAFTCTVHNTDLLPNKCMCVHSIDNEIHTKITAQISSPRCMYNCADLMRIAQQVLHMKPTCWSRDMKK